MNTYHNAKERSKQKYKEKEERTDLQRTLGDLVRLFTLANTLLAIIAMVLVGLFIRLVFS